MISIHFGGSNTGKNSPIRQMNQANGIPNERIGSLPSSRTSSKGQLNQVNSPFNFIPSGFFQGLALQLPFRRKNRRKVDDRNTVTFRRSSQLFNDDNVNDYDDNWEHIELIQFSQQVVVDPANETGVGHSFSSVQLSNPTWCDRCGDFIWGISKLSVRCGNCNYTCHELCQDLVTLDCKILHNKCPSSNSDKSAINDVNRDNVDTTSDSCSGDGHEIDVDSIISQEQVLDEEFDGDQVISSVELMTLLENFNKMQIHGLRMTMHEDGHTFRGFIRVHMNLSRPINVVAGTRPPSIYDIIYDEEESMKKTLTSFYLPRDTIKALHITSETTALQVIISLLKKFKVVDNPRKFALYERYLDNDTNQMKMRRFQDGERPLMLALRWGTSELENRTFVLQENDTGDILWDAFSMPELNNFLRILDREEEEYLNQVKIKYKLMHEQIEELITQSKSK